MRCGRCQARCEIEHGVARCTRCGNTLHLDGDFPSYPNPGPRVMYLDGGSKIRCKNCPDDFPNERIENGYICCTGCGLVLDDMPFVIDLRWGFLEWIGDGKGLPPRIGGRAPDVESSSSRTNMATDQAQRAPPYQLKRMRNGKRKT